jgi:hypothetical protein
MVMVMVRLGWATSISCGVEKEEEEDLRLYRLSADQGKAIP